MERWLLEVIGTEPMTFEQILRVFYREHLDDDVIAELMRSSRFSFTRSLRRALGRLCDLNIIRVIGRRPHRYRLHPFFGGCEHNPVQVALLCRIVKVEEADFLTNGTKPLGGAAVLRFIAECKQLARRP
jgi:hypothetical protein